MAMTRRGGGRGIPSRPPRLTTNRVYEDFIPMSEWRQEDDHDVLLIYLPGFQKEYIKVTTEDVNIVRVRGERLVLGNKWSRFQEDYRVPEDCEMGGIRAKFDGGILTITMPRKITVAPPPTTTAMTRVAPKTDEQPSRSTKQEETLRKPEEPKTMPRKITGAPPPPPTTTKTIAATNRVAPKTEEQPSRRTKQEETIRKPEEPKAMPRKITGAPPPPPTTTNTIAAKTRVAPKTEEQLSRKTKQKETTRKSEEPKEKKPDKPQTSPEDITLPAPRAPKPTSSSSAPTITKQPPPPQAKEAVELTTGALQGDGFEHDVVENPGVGNKGKATLEEEGTKRDFEGKPSSSGVGGGFRAGFEKLVAMRGMMNEDRKLLLNVGVGILIIAALGVQVSYTIGLIGKEK